MHPINYLIFTLVSILIQFCVMDLIQDKTEIDKNTQNTSIAKRNLERVLKTISEKPHGIYYQYINTSDQKYYNASLFDATTPILDWIYDENMSTTDEAYTTELFVGTEYNTTEITLFEVRNNTGTVKPILPSKEIASNNNCDCNLLYKICDINCCCDNDCKDIEKDLFSCEKQIFCNDLEKNTIPLCNYNEQCVPKHTPSSVENLFCIAKTNLPNRFVTEIKFDVATLNVSPKWHNFILKQEFKYDFKRTVYKYNEPIWIISNGTIFYIEMPLTTVSDYCNAKKPIKFLVNENTKCIVNLRDLHMFEILKNIEGSILSPTMKAVNSTIVNTSTFHFTNWTIIICDELSCDNYNKSVHEPLCSDNYCRNIATTVIYQFYYHDSKITKAVLKFYVENIAVVTQYIKQSIQVKFYLSNETIENIIKLSGNPGYIWNLPVIISTAQNNHTLHFFNNTFKGQNILTIPEIKDRKCLSTPVLYKIVKFGQNKRIKCRFVIEQQLSPNATKACQFIQDKILDLLKLNQSKYISAYGDPQNQQDEDWLHPQTFEKYEIYGKYHIGNTLLSCNNLITRVGYVFAYANVNNGIVATVKNKIVHVNVEGTAQNVTLYMDDVWTVITVDSNFIDVSKPNVVEYAGAPHLNIYLPNSFFLPSNSGNYHTSTVYVRLTLCLTIMYMNNA